MEIKTITAFSGGGFRKWLQKNYDKEKKVGVIIYKKHTGKPSPTHRELMEEAICYGWIDTTVKKLDEDRYLRNFTKRNMNSKWSENTLGYGKKLIKEGKMTPEGLKFYKLGLSKETHDYGIPKNPEMPSELEMVLSKDERLKRDFEKLAPSKRKMFYRWIIRAKLLETKNRRIEKIVGMLREGGKDIF